MSVSLPFLTEFEEFRLRFYENRRKVVPKDLGLTPLAMAVWFMDDGSRKSNQCRGLYLNTQSFTELEVELLRSVIRRDVGVQTSVRQQRDGLQIYIPSSSVTELIVYMHSEILPSMRYKLPT